MNDAAAQALWKSLEALADRVLSLEGKVEFLKGQVKARLKEEAEARRHYGGWKPADDRG